MNIINIIINKLYIINMKQNIALKKIHILKYNILDDYYIVDLG